MTTAREMKNKFLESIRAAKSEKSLFGDTFAEGPILSYISFQKAHGEEARH
jgi:hypothetical protein